MDDLIQEIQDITWRLTRLQDAYVSALYQASRLRREDEQLAANDK